MSSFGVAFFLVFAVCLSAVYADAGQRDPEVEKAAVTILNAAGDFIDVVQSVKITEAAAQGIHGESGRGSKKMMRMAIPLVVGFKVAGIIVAAMTALKVLVLKTVLMSGLALIASIALGGKQIYDKMKEKKASQELPHGTPYFYPGMTAQADMSWDPSNAAAAAAGGYEIHALGAAGSPDLSHLGTEYQASYAPSSFSSTGAAMALGNNGTSFGFVPGTHFIPVAERKSYVRPPLYKTTLYKTTVKEVK